MCGYSPQEKEQDYRGKERELNNNCFFGIGLQNNGYLCGLVPLTQIQSADKERDDREGRI